MAVAYQTSFVFHYIECWFTNRRHIYQKSPLAGIIFYDNLVANDHRKQAPTKFRGQLNNILDHLYAFNDYYTRVRLDDGHGL